MNDRTNHDQLPSPLIYWEGGIKRRQKDDFKEAMTNPELHLASVTVIPRPILQSSLHYVKQQ